MSDPIVTVDLSAHVTWQGPKSEAPMLPQAIRTPAYAEAALAHEVIGHLGDLVAYFSAQADQWRAVAETYRIDRIKTQAELTAAWAESEPLNERSNTS